ncbi:MAG TPA: hypothetical protein VEB21_13095, partial [Terriglobales bacterium]|nr:hypothetical protein [Terriglobales bacterium]
MDLDLAPEGLSLRGLRLALGPGGPGAVVYVDGVARRWSPRRFEKAGRRLRAENGPGGVAIELQAEITASGDVDLHAQLHNCGRATITVESLIVLQTHYLLLGDDSRRWRTYRNGYQSWSGTRTLATAEVDRDLPFAAARAAVTDARHKAPARAGHVRSDTLSVICEP